MRNENVSTKKIILLIVLSLLYKLVLEYSFWKVLTVDYPFYVFHFDLMKYINGTAWVLVVLGLVNYRKKLASTFFLFFLILLQIIPISSIYALTANNSPVYFNLLCVSFALCEILVSKTEIPVFFLNNKTISRYLIPVFFALSVLVLVLIYLKNGLPGLSALNLFSVYDLRRNSTLVLGKIERYLLNCTVTVFLPVIMIRSVNYKKIWIIFGTAVCILAVYLYTGHKTYLFSIALCILGAYFANKDDAFQKFFLIYLLGFIGISALSVVWHGFNNIAFKTYSLLVRRAIFTPAELKFVHFDYFSHHPFLLLAGVIPIVVNPLLPSYYLQNRYTLEIGKIYYNAPEMSADTGFFIEGYSRFGYVGLVLAFVLLWIILKKIDAFQERNGYVTAISFFIYPIYALSEQQIIGTLFFGTWMFWFIILNHYDDSFGSELDRHNRDKPLFSEIRMKKLYKWRK